jgi:RimJ/RimL family protein N-acetyltransferase
MKQEEFLDDDYSDSHIFSSVCLVDKTIGFVNFNAVSDGYELSYCFHSDYQGCGYASEAIDALLKHMEKCGNKHIVVGTALNNIPSVVFLQKN